MKLGVTRKSVDYGNQSNNMGYVELILINFLIDKFRIPKKKILLGARGQSTTSSENRQKSYFSVWPISFDKVISSNH